jgi:DNA-binding CsgD family transcriptional regulator/tetratricopeptide (TPR) repeat protein
MPPYWPWTELLRCCLRDDATSHAARRAGTTAQLAELVPELAPTDQPSPSPRRSYDAARFQLFDAVASTLEHAAQQAPILAVIEDLHWSDEASAALVAFVARRAASARVMFLGTCREEPSGGAQNLVSRLAGPAGRTLPLDGLARDEVEALFTAVSYRRPDAALLNAIHRHTGGNPFFVTEIARWMMSSHAVEAAGDAPLLRIPGSVWSVIRRRFDQLTGPARRALRTAAALGGEFERGLLHQICDDDVRAKLPALLTEAAAENVIRHHEDDTFAFRHPLIRQALYEEIPVAERTQLHGRIADVYRGLAEDDAKSWASEIAHHLTRAGGERAEDLAFYARVAGEQALGRYAYADAAAHFERVLRGATHPADEQTASVFVGLGRALAATSLRWNRQRAWEHVRSAVEYYIGHAKIAEAVAAATDASLIPEGVGRITPTLERLLEAVNPDSAEAGWLHARNGAAIYFETGDYERARQQLVRALELAADAGDVGLELRALSYATSIDHFAVRWENLLGECQHVVELARLVDDPHAETYARYRAAYTLAFSGHPAEARLQARLHVAQAERLADPGLLADALYVRMALAQFTGEWSAAVELAARGLEVSPHHLPILHLRTMVAFELGTEEEGRNYLDRLCDASAQAGPYPLRGGLHKLALTESAELRGERIQQPDAEPAAIHMALLLDETVPTAFAAVHDNDSARATAALTALLPYAGIIIAPPQVTDRLLGRLAAVAGDHSLAARHFENALAFCRRAGYQPELAWTCYDYARFLLARGQSQHHQTVGALTVEARTLARSLGMLPLLKRVAMLEAEQDELTAEGPGGLTPREIEILRLIATGQTNKAIAKQLDISRNTVAVHVSRILAKTGARNRTEAARFAKAGLPPA